MNMRSSRVLSFVLASLTLLGCGARSDYEQAEYPVAPPAYAEGYEPAEEQAGEPAEQEEQVEQEEQAVQVDEYEDTDPAALSDFKPALDPYGTWTEDATYGTVWVPSRDAVGSDFAPYVSSGHWEITDDDQYLWVSDYDPTFGWVVFHYGRWVWSTQSGWVWIPGRRYAPAWVVWRVGEPGYDYVGWAPMPPSYYWHTSTIVWLGVYPPAPYVFCSSGYLFDHHVHHHIVHHDHIAAVARSTRPYGAMPAPSQHHALAAPQPGPSVRSGHVPASAWPGTRAAPRPAAQAAFTRPSGQGRVRYAKPTTPSAATPRANRASMRAVPSSRDGRLPARSQPTFSNDARSSSQPRFTPRSSTPSTSPAPRATPRPSSPTPTPTPRATPRPSSPTPTPRATPRPSRSMSSPSRGSSSPSSPSHATSPSRSAFSSSSSSRPHVSSSPSHSSSSSRSSAPAHRASPSRGGRR